MKRLQLLSLLLFVALQSIQSQSLQVSNAITPEQMVDMIVGPGVAVSNVVYTGADIAHGEFWGGPGNIGIEEGIILTSGDISIAPGPNSSGSAGFNNGGGSDPDLEMHSGVTVHDAAILEFNFIPDGPYIVFSYVFGSEEYHEYVGSSVNDVFGFFLSGPGINGVYSNNAENVARIPSSITHVSINTLNYGNPYGSNCNNCQYFVNNTEDFIQYDAFSTVLNAFWVLQPGETYHLKMAIGDGGDGIFDSGVFIESGSFASTSVGIDDPIKKPGIDFFPNPVIDKLTIHSKEASVVEIFNSFGQKMYSSPLDGTLTIDVSELPEGIYILRQNGERTLTAKFVKKL